LHDPANPNSLLDSRISALYEDQKGRLLVGTYQSGLHIYDPKNEAFFRLKYDADKPNQLHAPYLEDIVWGSDPFVQIIHQDQNGGYWVGTAGKGINYFDPVTNKLSYYPSDAVNPTILWSFLEDRQGNLWLGSRGIGLYRKDPFARKFTLSSEYRNTQTAYESPLNPGTIWVCTLRGGLIKMNLKLNKVSKFMPDKNDNKSIGHNWVRTVYQENSRILWVGLGNGNPYNTGDGDGGLDRMDIETGTFTHYKIKRNETPDGYSQTVFTLTEDREGCLWLGTGHGGIYRSDKDKKEFKHFNFPGGDSASIDVLILDVQMDSEGTIWAGDQTKNGTLYRYNRQKDQFFSVLKGFKVTAILKDINGWLWLSTWAQGVLHLNPDDGSYIQYTKEDGLLSDEANCIIEGEDGTYWIGSRNGPSKIEPKTGRITSVNLPVGGYNLGAFRSIDGRLFFGSGRGLVSFHPDEISGNPFPPDVILESIQVTGESFNLLNTKSKKPEGVVLSQKQNDLTFEYVGLHYSDPVKNQYQYMLEPYDTKWIDAGTRRTARYTNLDPGEFTFHVKASNSDGVWNERGTSQQITIQPPLRATWWAYVCYTIFGILLFYFSRRYELNRLSLKLGMELKDSEARKLKEVDQLKSKFFANITHEFRTPLTVILGMTSSIKSDVQKVHLEEAEKPLEMIQRNGENLLQLVNQMLDLAKLESGKLKLQLEQSDIIPFVKYLCESFQSLAEQKGMNLTVYTEIDPLVMDFDGEKLSVVISNLLSNAVKFTPPDGKIIAHLNTSLKNGMEFFVVKIKDSGVGIPMEELPNIFNRFYQVDSSSTRQGEGTGIGLSLCKELVELMNGTINVKSSPGKGSEFTIEIPVTRTASIAKDVVSILKPSLAFSDPNIEFKATVTEDSNLPLVLLIEDNMDLVHYLKTCLERKYQILHAANGITGIEVACEKIPDLIISDVMMPGKDGFEVCSNLKTDVRTDHIPIIILSAKVTDTDRLAGLSHGADAYLTKPFIKAELLTRIDRLLLSRKNLIRKLENDTLSHFLKRRAESPEDKFLQKVFKSIHKEISNPYLNSETLAHNLQLSKSQLYRKLKAVTGKSVALFIRSVRLQKARELIQTTDKTISEISYELGFNDPAWFSRVFKEEFGFSPSETDK
jgi:signal transduction histidine kinase/DNA-binding response OmpR family regulator/ligand-binding sensor domain-containing protein